MSCCSHLCRRPVQVPGQQRSVPQHRVPGRSEEGGVRREGSCQAEILAGQHAVHALRQRLGVGGGPGHRGAQDHLPARGRGELGLHALPALLLRARAPQLLLQRRHGGHLRQSTATVTAQAAAPLWDSENSSQRKIGNGEHSQRLYVYTEQSTNGMLGNKANVTRWKNPRVDGEALPSWSSWCRGSVKQGLWLEEMVPSQTGCCLLSSLHFKISATTAVLTASCLSDSNVCRMGFS